MQYNLEINGESQTLNVATDTEGRATVTTGGAVRELAYRRIDTHHLALEVDGVRVNAFVRGDGDTREILIDGVIYHVGDADRQVLAAASGAGGHDLPREVTPPMPAVVVAILVAAGQDVARGDDLVVVAAMKMETTLTAPFDGRVARVNVAAGDKVRPGDILVDLEPVS
jgi:acetyl/propionyl-CoA carboxylase alpha subunit